MTHPNAPDARPDNTFEPATEQPRRERTTLYVVTVSIDDAKRRARVRRLLAAFGHEVASGAYEVPTSAAGARALERSLAYELLPEDSVRIYPVCARCRGETRLWGDGELSGLTPALIF